MTIQDSNGNYHHKQGGCWITIHQPTEIVTRMPAASKIAQFKAILDAADTADFEAGFDPFMTLEHPNRDCAVVALRQDPEYLAWLEYEDCRTIFADCGSHFAMERTDRTTYHKEDS